MPAPVVETISPDHRLGHSEQTVITAIVRATVDGTEGRYLVTFVPEIDFETLDIMGTQRTQDNGLLAFVVDLNKAAAGNVDHPLKGDRLFVEWLPALQQALKEHQAANGARAAHERAHEVAQLNATTDATIRDALTRLDMEWTAELDAAARRVIWPGMTQLEDKELPDFKRAVERELHSPLPR